MKCHEAGFPGNCAFWQGSWVLNNLGAQPVAMPIDTDCSNYQRRILTRCSCISPEPLAKSAITRRRCVGADRVRSWWDGLPGRTASFRYRRRVVGNVMPALDGWGVNGWFLTAFTHGDVRGKNGGRCYGVTFAASAVASPLTEVERLWDGGPAAVYRLYSALMAESGVAILCASGPIRVVAPQVLQNLWLPAGMVITFSL